MLFIYNNMLKIYNNKYFLSIPRLKYLEESVSIMEDYESMKCIKEIKRTTYSWTRKRSFCFYKQGAKSNLFNSYCLSF